MIKIKMITKKLLLDSTNLVSGYNISMYVLQIIDKNKDISTFKDIFRIVFYNKEQKRIYKKEFNIKNSTRIDIMKYIQEELEKDKLLNNIEYIDIINKCTWDF